MPATDPVRKGKALDFALNKDLKRYYIPTINGRAFYRAERNSPF
jgi:hypothetical protein